MSDAGQRSLGQLAVGGNLAPVDGEQRRTVALIEDEFVIARDILRPVGMIVIERAHAGKRPYQFVRRNLVAEILIHHLAKESNFRWLGRDRIRISDKVFIGCPDQRELACKRQDEYNASVLCLQQVAILVFKVPADDDVTTLDQPYCLRQRLADHGIRHGANPWPRRIDEDASGFHLAPSAGIQYQLPFVSPLSPRAAGASTNHGTTLGGIERSKYNKAGIIDPTVRIFEAIPKGAFQ